MAASEVSLAAAFAAGVASFSSPCVLPLVPAYLSVVGGLEIAGAPTPAERPHRVRRVGRLTRDTVLFVVGFGTVFVLLGLSASAAGRAVVHQQALLTRVSGVVVVAMAVFLAGTLFLRNPGLYREWRLHPRLARLGPFTAPVAGAAFAFGWTPCVGPILASVLALSADQGHLGQGTLLLCVYTVGLATPFLLVAAFFDRVRAPLDWLRRHGVAVTALSAGLLGGLGVLLVLDRLAWITTVVQSAT